MKTIKVQLGNYKHPSGLTLEIRGSGTLVIHLPDGNIVPDWHFAQSLDGSFDGTGTEFLEGIAEDKVEEYLGD